MARENQKSGASGRPPTGPPRQTDSAGGPQSQRPGVLSTADIIKGFGILVAFFGAVGIGLGLAKTIPLRAITQGALVPAGLFLMLAEAVNWPVTPRETREQTAWVLLGAAIMILCFTQSPSLTWIIPSVAVLALYALAQWDCVDRAESSDSAALGYLYSLGVSVKRKLGWRRTTSGFAATTILLAAGAGAYGATFAGIAEPERHSKLPPSLQGLKTVKASVERAFTTAEAIGSYTSNQEVEGSEPTTNEGSAPPAESAPCSLEPHYAHAEWAEPRVMRLLNEEVKLGEPLEGCVNALNVEYLANGSFVWGLGFKQNESQALSLVFLSKAFPDRPGIVIQPAVGPVERLIRHYHLIWAPKPWPHYKAGPGDFYLFNTEGDGTCVLIRPKSGSERQVLPFTTLYPSAANAWALIIRLSKKWQWLSEHPRVGEHGETIFELYASDAEIADAKIIFNPHTLTATWYYGGESETYSASQNNIDPSELEEDVLKYL